MLVWCFGAGDLRFEGDSENVEDVEEAKTQRAGKNYGGGMDSPRLIQVPCPGSNEFNFEACLLSFGVCWSS